IRLGAKCGHIPRTELAPVRKCRRKPHTGFAGAQLQKSMPNSTSKSLLQPPGQIEINRRRSFLLNQREAAMRSQDWDQGESIHAAKLSGRKTARNCFDILSSRADYCDAQWNCESPNHWFDR